MKTLHVTDEEYAILLNALKYVAWSTQVEVHSCEREMVFAEYKGDDKKAAEHKSMMESFKETVTEHEAVHAAIVKRHGAS